MGANVGTFVGMTVGVMLGVIDGASVGSMVGVTEGAGVGSAYSHAQFCSDVVAASYQVPPLAITTLASIPPVGSLAAQLVYEELHPLPHW